MMAIAIIHPPLYQHSDMNDAQLRISIKQIGCTGAQLARWLGVTPLTVTRWRTGAIEVPGPAALAIKALASGWRP